MISQQRVLQQRYVIWQGLFRLKMCKQQQKVHFKKAFKIKPSKRKKIKQTVPITVQNGLIYSSQPIFIV